MKYLLPIIAVFCVACQNKKDMIVTEPIVKKDSIKAETLDPPKINETLAKDWLKSNIEAYFKTENDYDKATQAMQAMTTKDYYEYKTDATNVDMDIDGTLTKAEFEKKWKSKFDTKKAGIESGFLISGQDWKEIKVTKWDIIGQKNDTLIFDVNIRDVGFNENYPRVIKVKADDGKFLIADVLEDE
ncbi:hypothetical protein [Soonwooa sp.]|uniref:hypothetical protein n=1 Tax=Soonwooa sp. TaxID=1938592 RepID=UPI002622A111|nr:hypothetical protein [Soonwooa sp.]